MTGFSVTRTVGWAALALLLSSVAANAQEWPTKQPIKVIVPFSAGSATDIVARTVFDQVGRQVGQSVTRLSRRLAIRSWRLRPRT